MLSERFLVELRIIASAATWSLANELVTVGKIVSLPYHDPEPEVSVWLPPTESIDHSPSIRPRDDREYGLRRSLGPARATRRSSIRRPRRHASAATACGCLDMRLAGLLRCRYAVSRATLRASAEERIGWSSAKSWSGTRGRCRWWKRWSNSRRIRSRCPKRQQWPTSFRVPELQVGRWACMGTTRLTLGAWQDPSGRRGLERFSMVGDMGSGGYREARGRGREGHPRKPYLFYEQAQA